MKCYARTVVDGDSCRQDNCFGDPCQGMGMCSELADTGGDDTMPRFTCDCFDGFKNDMDMPHMWATSRRWLGNLGMQICSWNV